jgi:hypothetical protein
MNLSNGDSSASVDSWLTLHIGTLNCTVEAEAEAEAEVEAYCRQPAGTLTPGIGRRSDPWPYICSMSRPLFFLPFVDPSY